MKSQLFSLLFLIIFFIGCSGHVGMSGKVVYSDNGEPVPMGEVQLYTPTFVAHATIRKDGTFDVGSYKEKDGLPPGTYNVAIMSTDVNGKALVDPKFWDSKTSGLTLTIDKTTRGFVFKVDRNPAPKPK